MIHFFVKYRIHFIGWALLFGIDFISGYFLGTTLPWYQYFIFYGMNMILFYIVSILAVLSDNWRNNPISIIGLIIFIGLFYYASCWVNIWISYVNSGVYKPLPTTGYAKVAWRCGTIIIYAIICYLIFRNGELKRRELEKERDKLRLESDLLKVQKALSHSQNSQHLIANSLTFVNNEVSKLAPDAGRGMFLLNELLDFGMNAPTADGKVFLSEELQQVYNMLELQKLIAHRATNISFKNELQDNFLGKRILPYQLLTFIENMFQHGDLYNVSAPPIIRIFSVGQELVFKTQNKRRSHRSKAGHGIGIEGIKSRMNYYYTANQYNLTIDEEGENYSVELKIVL